MGTTCKTQSKKRSDAAAGAKGTPFNQCVTATAKLATVKERFPERGVRSAQQEALRCGRRDQGHAVQPVCHGRREAPPRPEGPERGVALAGTDPIHAEWSTREVLRAATVEGARACGLLDQIGTITPGKAADLVLLRPSVNLAPIWNPVGSIVTAADISNVDTVLVDGRVVKEGGELVGVDLHKIIGMAEETQSYVFGALGWSPDEPVPAVHAPEERVS